MKLDDVTCSACEAVFRRVELRSEPGPRAIIAARYVARCWGSSMAQRLSPIGSRSNHRRGAFESGGFDLPPKKWTGLGGF
jgi:hypothetical protein